MNRTKILQRRRRVLRNSPGMLLRNDVTLAGAMPSQHQVVSATTISADPAARGGEPVVMANRRTARRGR